MVDIDAELALAGVLGEVADMAIGREDLVIGAEIALDGPGLGGGFDDDEVLWHGRECSTGSCTDPYPVMSGRGLDDGAPEGRESDLADAPEEVLVDLELAVGLGVVAGRQGIAGRHTDAPLLAGF